jgi:hypothetical protein
MSGFAAYCPIANLGTVRQLLDEAGWGPENFSVPLRDGTDAATHAGLHAWGPPEFRQSLLDLAHLGVTVHDNEQEVGDGTISMEPVESFGAMTTAAVLDWSDPSDWFVNPVMTGDQRAFDGKTWASLVDYNVWTPPVGWREVVATGYPAWTMPSGSADSYVTGERVTHDNPQDGGALWVYESTYTGNTAEPGRDGTFDRYWTPIERVTAAEPEPEPTGWVDTGATVTSQAGQLYYVSAPIATLGLTVGQAIRLGSAETTYASTWAGTDNLMQINPYVAASVGAKVWKWA